MMMTLKYFWGIHKSNVFLSSRNVSGILNDLLIVKDRFCIDLKRRVKRGGGGEMETKLFKFEVVDGGIARASHRCWRRSHDELSVEMSQALKILVMKRNYGRRRTKHHQALALLATTLCVHTYTQSAPPSGWTQRVMWRTTTQNKNALTFPGAPLYWGWKRCWARFCNYWNGVEPFLLSAKERNKSHQS